MLKHEFSQSAFYLFLCNESVPAVRPEFGVQDTCTDEGWWICSGRHFHRVSSEVFSPVEGYISLYVTNTPLLMLTINHTWIYINDVECST